MSTTVDLGKITASVTVGTTTTGAAGTNASVSNSGTTQDAVLNFTIPRGAQGVQGPQGSTGPAGPAGPTGPQGPMGDVAVITPEQQAAFTMYSTTGQNTNGPMTQKAVTDALAAGSISYDNSQSGLAATDVQGALGELNSGLNDYEEISWISVPLHNGWINDSQNWASRANTRYRVWPVAEGEVYKLTTNSVGAIQAAWLASYNYSSDPTSGSPDFAPNYTGKLPQQAMNTTKEYIVPSGAHFLYILYYVNGANRTPSYWGKKYNKIDSLAEMVSANENALQNINVENLDFSGDVTNDLVLSDEDNFDIVQFRNGHIFTKNFASDKMKIAAYLQNRCSGKICAIVGDSISSYDGQAPSGYAYYYPQGNVNNVNATWWKITCDILGMTPVNCAWSGSKTIGAPKGATAVAGCSDQRIADCGRNGTPDIIIFYMGTNDFGNEVALGTWDVNTAIIDDSEYTSSQQISNFRDAYALMLKKARVAYPDAKIYCCTLIDTVTLDSNAGWPSNNGNGVTIYTWNENIKEIADALGCSVIDLHSCGLHFFNIENHSVDATKGKVPGLHPDSWGHIQIAAKVITHLISE